MDKKSWNLSSITLKIEGVSIKCSFTSGITDFNYHLTDMAHMHSDYELHYVFEGECILEADEEKYVLSENTLCVVPAFCSHFFPKTEKECRGFGILLSVKDNYNIDSKITSYLKISDKITILQNDPKVRIYFEDFLDSYQYQGFGYENKMESALTLLIFEIINKIGCRGERQKRDNRNSPDSTEIMLETIIMSKYLKNISLNDIAKIINFTPAHTGRLIKKIYKKSYSKLILELKMKYAKKKILSTNIPFGEIAEMVGYDSYTGFWMAFKRYWGMSPEQMKKGQELKPDGGNYE